MGNVISCRTGVFGGIQGSFENFPKGGVYHAEAPPPADGDYQAMARLAADHGVTIATLATQLHLDSEEKAESFIHVIDGAQAIEVPKIFVSVKAGDDTPRDDVMTRLRRLSEYAHSAGVTICMETHPPYGTNAQTARQTIETVGSDGLRYNFDTANVYYYNEGADTITELTKARDLIASVHLKDTDGGFKSANFPPLGQGVVDFKRTFEMLGETGFNGPYTLEIEGANVSGLDTEGRLQFLKDCVAYLRKIGALD